MGAVELVLAALLLWRRMVAAAAIGALWLSVGFGGFGVYQLTSSDRRPCGCFGAWISVTPWLTILGAAGLVLLPLRVIGDSAEAPE